MNEQTSGGTEGTGGSMPRCHMATKADSACWREAVEPRFSDEDEPRLCVEHARVVELHDEMEDWRRSLRLVDGWIRGLVARSENDELARLAHDTRDEVRRKYGELAVRAHAARMVAYRGPMEAGGEISVSFEQEEELARRVMLADALADVRGVLEDLSEDTLFLRDKWATIDLLAAATTEANEEIARYKAQLGIPAD